MKYGRLKENLQILDAHNHGHGTVIKLTGGAKYEPELIDEIVSDCREILNKIEARTLIELPCKVGDAFYGIPGEHEYFKYRVNAILIDKNGRFQFETSYGKFTLGSDAFLTPEKAENRLKKLKEKRDGK